MNMEKTCSCGAQMLYRGRQTIHMNGGRFLMEYSTNFQEVDLYVCPACKKMEFYAVEIAGQETDEERAMRTFAKASPAELRRLMEDTDYPPEIRAAFRRLLEQKEKET